MIDKTFRELLSEGTSKKMLRKMGNKKAHVRIIKRKTVQLKTISTKVLSKLFKKNK